MDERTRDQSFRFARTLNVRAVKVVRQMAEGKVGKQDDDCREDELVVVLEEQQISDQNEIT